MATVSSQPGVTGMHYRYVRQRIYAGERARREPRRNGHLSTRRTRTGRYHWCRAAVSGFAGTNDALSGGKEPAWFQIRGGIYKSLAGTARSDPAEPEEITRLSNLIRPYFSTDLGSKRLNDACLSRPCGVRSTNSISAGCSGLSHTACAMTSSVTAC